MLLFERRPSRLSSDDVNGRWLWKALQQNALLCSAIQAIFPSIYSLRFPPLVVCSVDPECRNSLCRKKFYSWKSLTTDSPPVTGMARFDNKRCTQIESDCTSRNEESVSPLFSLIEIRLLTISYIPICAVLKQACVSFYPGTLSGSFWTRALGVETHSDSSRQTRSVWQTDVYWSAGESRHLLLLLLLQFPVSTTWVMTIRRANEFQKHDAFANITHSSINNEAKHTKKTITARNMSACSKSASFRVGKHTLLVVACWIRWQQITSYCWYSELQVCADSKRIETRELSIWGFKRCVIV